MTWFLICCIAVFILSLVSNVLFLLSPMNNLKGGSILGIIVFTALTVWAISLIISG